MAGGKQSFSDRLFSDKTALVIAVISLVVLFGSLIVFLVLRSWHFSYQIDEQIIANYGDFVGGVVGTLLAFTAAILYYVALKEQRKDIENNKKSLILQNKTLEQQIEEFRQQRVELEETRKVYERQTTLMIEQSHVMKQQQFEASFYAMLKLYIDYKIQMNNKENDCFKRWIDNIDAKLTTLTGMDNIFDRHKKIMSLYENLYLEKQDILSPYFMTVYRILCMIDNTASLDDNWKIQYLKIFRAQLSDYETKLLYYNYHSDFSGSARDLAYKFNFLKHYDYLTSLDAKHIHGENLVQDKALTQFFHLFDVFIKDSINKYCEGFEEEDPCFQKSFDYKNIISEITSTPDIIITISIPSGDEKLTKEFCVLFSDFVCERLFLSQFSRKKETIELSESGEDDNRRIYKCIIHGSFIQKIKTDNEYE